MTDREQSNDRKTSRLFTGRWGEITVALILRHSCNRGMERIPGSRISRQQNGAGR
jgi:hypothetical protein